MEGIINNNSSNDATLFVFESSNIHKLKFSSFMIRIF